MIKYEERVMENGLESRLNKLKTDFARMCRTVEGMLAAVNALLVSPDKTAAADIVARDRLVDEAEADIENGCMRLLLRNQPFARDFREISCMLKAITDVERIGDQSADIAGLTLSFDKGVKESSLPKMGALALVMVRDAVNSLINEDVELALKTQALDDGMDELFDVACAEIVDEIKQNPAFAGEAAELLMIAKYYERIGDHAVNICEWAEFGNTGVRNKHQ